MPRYRRRMRGLAVRPVNAVKYLVTLAPASVAAATNNPQTIAKGTDSAVAGQSSVLDTAVPVGASIKEIDIQFSIQNLVNIAAFCWISIQRVENGQSPLNSRTWGGTPQRNQVHWQKQFCVGQNQNVNVHKTFKVPRKFQRMVDGREWVLQIQCDQISTQAAQFIYKFYQ